METLCVAEFWKWISLNLICAQYLESLGNKVYTEKEARLLFAQSSEVNMRKILPQGDLLKTEMDQYHRAILFLAQKAKFKGLIRQYFHDAGILISIGANK